MTAAFSAAYTSRRDDSPLISSVGSACALFAAGSNDSVWDPSEHRVSSIRPIRLYSTFFAMAMLHNERKSRRHLTDNRADPRLSLSGGSRAIFGALLEKSPVLGNSGSGNDEDANHSRNVCVLLHRAAGVCRGLDSDSSSRSPTTHPLIGAVGFCIFGATFNSAPVAKWLTRGSAKPVFVGSIPTRCSNDRE